MGISVAEEFLPYAGAAAAQLEGVLRRRPVGASSAAPGQGERRRPDRGQIRRGPVGVEGHRCPARGVLRHGLARALAPRAKRWAAMAGRSMPTPTTMPTPAAASRPSCPMPVPTPPDAHAHHSRRPRPPTRVMAGRLRPSPTPARGGVAIEGGARRGTARAPPRPGRGELRSGSSAASARSGSTAAAAQLGASSATARSGRASPLLGSRRASARHNQGERRRRPAQGHGQGANRWAPPTD